MNHHMTPTMKKMLLEIADGMDINITAQIARVLGRKAENKVARTTLALLRRNLLAIAKGGGLEISAIGRAEAEKLRTKKGL